MLFVFANVNTLCWSQVILPVVITNERERFLLWPSACNELLFPYSKLSAIEITDIDIFFKEMLIDFSRAAFA